jgi:hypothetical protein
MLFVVTGPARRTVQMCMTDIQHPALSSHTAPTMRALSALQLVLILLGLASLVCIPEHFVQNVYVDENALMPNGAFPQITPGTVEFHRAAVALQKQLARASAEKCASE